MAKKEYTFEELSRDIVQKKFSPIYFFMGDEPFFMDKLTDLLITNVLSEDERDFNQPIVSVSLGMPAVFQIGGFARGDKVMKLPLYHGDVLVWGGESRLRFHGVMPIKAASHPAFGEYRINLTFRKAG